MTSDPLTPSPLSGPVDDECAALRAEVERLRGVEANLQRVLGELTKGYTRVCYARFDAEAERDEARAQLAEARQRIVERQDIIADWMNAAGDARRRAAAAEARLEAVQALPAVGPSVRRRALDDELDESADSATGFEYGWLRAMETVRAALAASPPEPETDVHLPTNAEFWSYRCGECRSASRCDAQRSCLGRPWPIAAPQPVDQPKCEHGEGQQ